MSVSEKEVSIALSRASKGEVNEVLGRIDFTVRIPATDEDVSTLGFDSSFVPFAWPASHNEKVSTPDLFAHISGYMGTWLKSQGYQMVDVHNDKKCLSFKSSKVGNLSGGTDLMIIPATLEDKIFFQQEIAVIFEWKTPSTINDEKSMNQAILELIAARCLSRQPQVAVILTDLSTTAIVFQTTLDKYESVFYIKKIQIDVNQIGPYMKHFLGTYTRKGPLRLPSIESVNEDERALAAFKKAKIEDAPSIAMEHLLEEMQDDSPENMEYRRLLAIEYFRSIDVEQLPAILTYPISMMYT
jgi:hypothetical protein